MQSVFNWKSLTQLAKEHILRIGSYYVNKEISLSLSPFSQEKFKMLYKGIGNSHC